MTTISHSVLEYIRYLSEKIGGRGSCTPGERHAAVYAAAQLKQAGVKRVAIEEFRGSPSTYLPYALAFFVTIVGSLLVWFFPDWHSFTFPAAVGLLGAGGMLLQSNLDSSWMCQVLRQRRSQNVVGVIPPKDKVKRRVVLCAHLDTHRTPVFYSSENWLKVFSLFLEGAFISMLLTFVFGILGIMSGWMVLRWVLLLPVVVELLAMALTLQAECTPYTPGANDNASGVGVCLTLAAEVARNPLENTEVWLALTGCEETSCDGMKTFLILHAAELELDAVYVIIDEVGLGTVTWLSSDGLIIKHPTHPDAVELIGRVKRQLRGVKLGEKVGQAFTDGLVATKQGRVALTLVAQPEAGQDQTSHWHQMSDTLEHVRPQALEDTCKVVRQLLASVDK